MPLYVVGLTGPTGAGKSAVAALLEKGGLSLIDADRLCREAVEPGTPCLAELAESFGRDILLPDGSLNRKELARRAFSSRESTERLNALVHPPVIAMTRERLARWEREGRRAALIDAPLLFESGLDAVCSLTVAVLAPEELRLRRIRERDGLTREEALRRMKAQPDEAYYRQRAGAVIENTGGLDSLRGKTEELLRQIREACP